MFFYKQAGVMCIDRGDVDAVDFDVNDFTKDGAWHDLDLSSIVGARVTRVDMRCDTHAEDGKGTIALKQKGITNDINIGFREALATGYPIYTDITVLTNPNGIIQYKLPALTYYFINLTVKRYYV